MDNTDIPSSDKYNSESVHCDKELLSDIQLAKDTGNIDILISFLSHKNDMVRRNAVIAIGSLRNKQALDPLIGLLETEFHETVLYTQLIHDIVLAIGSMPDVKGLKALTKLEQSMLDEKLCHGRRDDTIHYGKIGEKFKVVPSNLVQVVREQIRIISNAIGTEETGEVSKMPEVNRIHDDREELIKRLESERLAWEEEERHLQAEIEKLDKGIAELRLRKSESRKSESSQDVMPSSPKTPQKEPCAYCKILTSDTNDSAVKAYTHPAVGEFIPAKSKTRYRKPSLWVRIKKFFRI